MLNVKFNNGSKLNKSSMFEAVETLKLCGRCWLWAEDVWGLSFGLLWIKSSGASHLKQ